MKGVSLEIHAGEFFVLVGLSGSGKTTLLKMMNGLIKADEGVVEIEGRPVQDWHLRSLRLDLGYVLQQGALFPHLTVEENLSVLPKMKKWSPAEIKDRIGELLPFFALEERDLLKYPHQLSGGEKQRVGILRAVMTRPKILLMDEPFSALDPLIRRELQQLMKRLHAELGMTVVFVTHDMREAVLLADRIEIVHEGNILQVDSPQNILKAPASDFVRQLFESEDLL